MTNALFYTGLAIAVIFIINYLVYRYQLEGVKYFTKPLVMISIILWTAVALEKPLALGAILLLCAQGFGFLGDVSLLVPKKGFIFGLAAFLVGHLFYIALVVMVILGALPFEDVRWYQVVFLGLGPVSWVLGMILFIRVFTPVLNARGASQVFQKALRGYAFVLSGLMGFSIALLRLMQGFTMHWLYVAIGGTLFFIADFLLAYDRFVSKNTRVHLVSWVCYHTAQISLAWGLVSLIKQVFGN
jgi:uncharacterized membrane protein YhhN